VLLIFESQEFANSLDLYSLINTYLYLKGILLWIKLIPSHRTIKFSQNYYMYNRLLKNQLHRVKVNFNEAEP
jgi:hypothetical protein